MADDPRVEAAARVLYELGGLRVQRGQGAQREVAKCIVAAIDRAAWRPISEAKRTGEEMLLGNVEFGYVASGFWDRSRQEWAGPGIDEPHPTHYQPLPAPPEQEDSDDG